MVFVRRFFAVKMGNYFLEGLTQQAMCVGYGMVAEKGSRAQENLGTSSLSALARQDPSFLHEPPTN